MHIQSKIVEINAIGKNRCYHDAVENVLVAKIRIKQTHNLKKPISPQE